LRERNKCVREVAAAIQMTDFFKWGQRRKRNNASNEKPDVAY